MAILPPWDRTEARLALKVAPAEGDDRTLTCILCGRERVEWTTSYRLGGTHLTCGLHERCIEALTVPVITETTETRDVAVLKVNREDHTVLIQFTREPTAEELITLYKAVKLAMVEAFWPSVRLAPGL